MKKISTNIKFILLQGCFFFMFCAAAGFISLYLQGMGLSESRIGLSVAIFSGITALIQPIIGNINDRIESLNWKKMIVFLSIIILIINVLMVLIKDSLLNSILLGLFFVSGSLVVPFINSGHYYYESKGEDINFGVSRGVGSGSFAIAAILIGSIADRFGVVAIPLMGVVTSAIFLLIALWMPYYDEVKEIEIDNLEIKKGSLFTFIKKYPAFSLMLISVFFLYSSQNVLGIYLLQIIQSLEGTTKEFGQAVALQAIVEIPMLFGFSYIMKKIKVPTLMTIAAVGYLAKASLYAISTNMNMIYFSQTFQIFSFAILVAASVYYTGQMVAKGDQTTGQALMASMSPAGAVFGSLVGGWLLEKWGVSTLLIFNVIVSALGLLIGIMTNLFEKKRSKTLGTIKN